MSPSASMALVLAASLPLSQSASTASHQDSELRQGFARDQGSLWADLSGVLVDEQGQPVAGCSVSLLQGEFPDFFSQLVDQSLTDAAGCFTLRADPFLQSVLGFDLEGELPSLHHVHVTAIAGRVVELGELCRGPRFTLRGEVLDESGAAVPNARIRVLSPYLGGVRSAANWFVSPLVSSGAYRLREEDVLFRGAGENWAVSDERGPYVPLLRSEAFPTTFTDAEGGWQLEVFGPGGALIFIDEPLSLGAVDSVALAPGEEPEMSRVELPSGRERFGRAARAGQAIANAPIWVGVVTERENEGFVHGRFAGRTAEDGSFVLSGLPEADNAIVLGIGGGAEDRFWLRRFLPNEPLALELPMTRDVALRVIGPPGLPAIPFRIQAPAVTGSMAAAFEGHTRPPDGEAQTVPDLWQAPATATLVAKGMQAVRLDLEEALSGNEVIEVRLTPAPQARIRCVTAETGSSVQGAAIWLESAIVARTDSDGVALVSLPSTEEGRAEAVLQIDAPGRRSVALRASDLAELGPGHELELHPATNYRGQVLQSGLPPSRQLVLQLHQPGDAEALPPRAPATRLAVVGKDGRFVVGDLAPGPVHFSLLPHPPTEPLCLLRFYGPSDPPTLFEGELVLPEDSREPILVDATPLAEREGMSITGRVSFAEREELSGVLVQATSHGVETRTDLQGRFNLAIPKGGKVDLQVFIAEGGTIHHLGGRELVLMHEQELSLDFDFRLTEALFRPMYGNGDRGWNHSLSAVRWDGNPWSSWGDTGLEGELELLLSGGDKWLVETYLWGMGLGAAVVELPLADPPLVTIPMTRCVPCSGKLVFQDRAPLDGEIWQLSLALEEAALPHVRGARNAECHVLVSADDCRFVAANIIPGSYTAFLRSTSGSYCKSEVFVVSELGCNDLKIAFKGRRR